MNKVIIVNHAEFHARAMKEINIDTMTKGYNFSYPVLNTIEIGNILILGGTIDVHIERQGKSVWTFDTEKSILTIDRNERIENHYIYDTRELYNEMSKYFNENVKRLSEKNSLTSAKKRVSKIGNQNASKQPAIISNNKQEEKQAEGIGIFNQHRPEVIKNQEINIDKVANEEPTEFCFITKYKGSNIDYYKWIIKNDWWDKLTNDDKLYAARCGIKKD